MIRSIVFWVCLPFVALQALRLKRTAPRFADARGPDTGSVGEGHEYRLIAVGDSIIAGVGAATYASGLVGQTAAHLADNLDCCINWSAVGLTGARAIDILDRLIPKIPNGQADFIVVSVGVNEVTGLAGIAGWKRDFGSILAALQRHSADAVVAVAGIPPMQSFPLLPQPLRALLGLRARSLDIALRAVISQYPNVVHVPLEFEPRPERFSADGYHPSEIGYRVFGEAVANLMIGRRNEIEAKLGLAGQARDQTADEAAR